MSSGRSVFTCVSNSGNSTMSTSGQQSEKVEAVVMVV